ncbi:MAG: DUF302 domain-containing protein [Nitrososphaerota archaeon]|nr:DUF302 domain-containing protein [Nitrososphaerota archaeon]
MQSNRIDYTVKASAKVAEVVSKLTEELKSRGFGVLSNIDVRKTIKEKIGEDLNDYVILDVCNPGHAKKALDAHKEVGLILPCKITVFEDKGRTIVSLYKPTEALRVTGFTDLESMASEVEKELVEVLNVIAN